MVRILILDIGNGMNKGNLALLYSTINTISKFIPDAEYYLMYYGESGSHSNLKLGETSLVGEINPKKPLKTILSVVYLFKCLILGVLKRIGINIPISKTSKLYEYYRCDCVVMIGGDTMTASGKYGVNILTPLINIYYAVALGRPTVLYGETIGNYNTFIKNIADPVFNRVSLIIVREDLSKQYLVQNNISTPKVAITADLAFTLSPASKKRALDILSQEGIEILDRPIIGINASRLIQKYIGGNIHKSEEKLDDILARTIDTLLEKLDVNILLVPHVFEPGPITDDRTAIGEIYLKVKNKSRVSVITGEYSPQELKAIIGLCDLFVGARMHATIASTSMLVPTVGLAYSPKMYGIIGEMLGQQKYIVDIKNINYDKLLNTILEAWENQTSIKADLEKRMPIVKDRAWLSGKYVKELIDHHEN
jgi:colanic acid/amylovoran biosynthesis protein